MMVWSLQSGLFRRRLRHARRCRGSGNPRRLHGRKPQSASGFWRKLLDSQSLAPLAPEVDQPTDDGPQCEERHHGGDGRNNAEKSCAFRDRMPLRWQEPGRNPASQRTFILHPTARGRLPAAAAERPPKSLPEPSTHAIEPERLLRLDRAHVSGEPPAGFRSIC